MTRTRYAPTVTAPPIQILLIWPDDTWELRVIAQSFQKFDETLGGRTLVHPTTHCDFLTDADAENKGCPVNRLASDLWWILDPRMDGQNPLRGVVLAIGLSNEEYPVALPVPEDVIELCDRVRASYEKRKDED